MRTTTITCGMVLALLGACSPLPTAQRDASSEPRQRPLSSPPYRMAPLKSIPEASFAALSEYKRRVAHRIVQVSRDTYSHPMPQMMKSIVVLEITVDRVGRAHAVSVYRSNGYVHLEERALASVAKAGPFMPPAPTLFQGADTVSFLETFLFRDDDAFQVRSLVRENVF
jgi:TonB family protein